MSKSQMRHIRRGFTASMSLLFAVAASAQSAAPTLDSAARIVAEAQAIPQGGIDELKAVDIGGIKQWISVRGTNPDNPVLLFIHGGPGSPMMPESWIFQRPWEDFFTVVQWDQRGAGKTLAAASGQPATPLTLDRMQADAEELVDYLRKTYGKQKIFLMGHSFGSVLGMRVALHRPDALYAYVGVGQMINARKNEAQSWVMARAAAVQAGNTAAVHELDALAPYPGPAGSPLSLEKIGGERKWVVEFGGMRYGRRTDPEDVFQSLSAAYNDSDREAAQRGEMQSVVQLVPQLMEVNFESSTSFACPVFFFAGRNDMATPSAIVEQFYTHVRAPKKALYTIDRAAHDVMFDAPGQMLVDLVRDIRPLATPSPRSGEYAAALPNQ
jgi:pimeloyl-ACP methyl ester carboxylesterase